MKVKIRRIGNSLGIILPKDILNLLELKENDEIEMNTKTKEIELKLSKK
jgi:putative addiction module antidote